MPKSKKVAKKSLKQSMQNAIDFLNGKKSYIGLAVLAVYGGLAYIGYEIPELKAVGEWVLALGAVHKVAKLA